MSFRGVKAERWEEVRSLLKEIVVKGEKKTW